MLSMEEFGQNISKLRKNLSITDATQVDTDSEYGVMQIEQDYQFSDIAGEDVIDPGNSSSPRAISANAK
jgi:hypothetical protein